MQFSLSFSFRPNSKKITMDTIMESMNGRPETEIASDKPNSFLLLPFHIISLQRK
uniref:Uncharacterized protein n=1 Tax=Octopus bimaculoides TaxID=37653 RepID=A0A0L8FZ78_OCTBM